MIEFGWLIAGLGVGITVGRITTGAEGAIGILIQVARLIIWRW